MAVTLAARSAFAVTVVSCVGDSITANSGWSDRLGARLGANYRANNYGVSGTTLLKKGDFPYWNTPAFTQSHSSGPGIVVIMLGTNDSKPQNWAHKADFVADYEALIDTYSALPSHPRIFLNLCPPAGTNGYGISGTVIENEILPLIRQVAAAKGAGIIDVFSAFGGHNFDPTLYGSAGDQVHPNAAGAQRIADTVYVALEVALDGGAPVGAADASAIEGGNDATADGGPGMQPGVDAATETGGPAGGAGPDASAARDAALQLDEGGGSAGQGDGGSVASGNASGSGAGASSGMGATGSPGGAGGGGGGSGCSLCGGAPPSRAAGAWWLVVAAVLRRRRRAN